VTIGSLLAGWVLLAGFVAIELRRAEPLAELDLLKIPTFTGGNIAVFVTFQFEKMIVFVFLALYLQRTLSRSAIYAGIVISVAIVPTLLTSRLAGKVRDRFGARLPLAIALVRTAIAVVAIGLSTIVDATAVIAYVLIGLGAVMPLIAVSARPALMGAVRPRKHGQASGVNLSLQMLGGTLAIAAGSPLLILTGSHWPLFVLTGLGTFGAALAAWTLIERPARTEATDGL
jgi:MFS family permease